MKTFLSTLALSLAVGFAASAAVPTDAPVQKMDNKAHKLMQLEAINAAQFTANPVHKKVRKAPQSEATVQDFCGIYEWYGNDLLGGDDGYNHGMFTIDENPDADYPNAVMISGFDPWVDYLEGYVSNGRLYVPNAFETMDQSVNQQVWFWNYTIEMAVVDGTVQYPVAKTNNEFYFTLEEDGMIVAGTRLDQEKFENDEYSNAELADMVCIASSVLPFYDPNNDPNDIWGYWICAWVEGMNVPTFEYNEAEWRHMGTGEFMDAWFQNWYDGEPSPWEVQIYRSRQSSTQFLVMNPFGPGTPWEDTNLSTTPGHIILDISDPQCLLVLPLVYTLELPITIDASMPAIDCMLYCFNDEGYQAYINGETTTDIIRNYLMERKTISTFDASTRTANIFNGRFSFKQAIFEEAFYSDSYQGYVVLPENYNEDAVETIGEEDVNAPTTYYNLQGVQLQKPEKGQLVIVRKGNKSSKVIVK